MKRGETEIKKEHKNQTIFLKNRPKIVGSYSIAGKKEGEGPLGKSFSMIMEDEYFGEKTHEQAEQKMFEYAIRGACKNAKMKPNEVEMMLAGDLLNQIISSSFAARSFDMTFVGLYGACSTMALTLGIGAAMVDAGHLENVVVSAGSHFATAERQYRTPLELGNTRPPVSQWTVTGCGAIVLSSAPRPVAATSGIKNAAEPKFQPCITAVTFGKVVDWGTLDPNNMGAAMAPAAAGTLIAHFHDIGLKPANKGPNGRNEFLERLPYDAIFSGDLGKLGETILRDLLANANYPVDARYSDCGRLIYSDIQNTYQGGSGCGCSAVTLNGFIMNKLRKGEFKKILFVATGALMSPVSSFQGNTIPGIAHAIVIESI